MVKRLANILIYRICRLNDLMRRKRVSANLGLKSGRLKTVILILRAVMITARCPLPSRQLKKFASVKVSVRRKFDGLDHFRSCPPVVHVAHACRLIIAHCLQFSPQTWKTISQKFTKRPNVREELHASWHCHQNCCYGNWFYCHCKVRAGLTFYMLLPSILWRHGYFFNSTPACAWT